MRARVQSLRLPVLVWASKSMGPLLSVSGWMNANTTQASLVWSPPLAAGLGAWLGALLGARHGARCDGDLLGECQLSCHGPAGQQPNDHQAQGRGPSYIFYFLNQHDKILRLWKLLGLFLYVFACLISQSILVCLVICIFLFSFYLIILWLRKQYKSFTRHPKDPKSIIHSSTQLGHGLIPALK